MPRLGLPYSISVRSLVMIDRAVFFLESGHAESQSQTHKVTDSTDHAPYPTISYRRHGKQVNCSVIIQCNIKWNRLISTDTT